MTSIRKRTLQFVNAMIVGCALASAAYAGPVIVGGDDLNDHGSWNGTTNIEGWRYIQNALSNIVAQVTRPGNSGRIVVLGAAPTVPASSTPTDGESCGAAYWPAQAIGRQVDCIDGAAGINTFFANLASGSVNPAVIVYPGDGASNGVDSAEEAAWSANAAAVAGFVASGGGLLAHSGEYTWLAALLPGIVVNPNCDESTATLQPPFIASFPAVTLSDIQAGPCHNTFTGNFGGLQVLVRDSSGLAMLLGGGAGTTFVAGPPADIPTLSEWSMIVMSLLIAITAVFGLRRR